MSDVLSTYTFIPWLRQGIANKVTAGDLDASVKLRATINVKLDIVGTPVQGEIDLVETIDKDQTFKNIFTVEIIMTTFDNFGNFEVKSNINEQKDMFKLNYPYDENFWNSQNQLLLTDEMTAFIEKMGKENKEFKVRGNIND